jgi:hypothetical protein
MAFCWARNVVEAAGHPTPGPRRFCKVTIAVCIRASFEALELSVGKETDMPGLFTTLPAATFALIDYESQALNPCLHYIVGWELSTHCNERITARWARARDFDDVSSSIANAIAVARTSGVQASLVAELGHESGVDTSV